MDSAHGFTPGWLIPLFLKEAGAQKSIAYWAEIFVINSLVSYLDV